MWSTSVSSLCSQFDIHTPVCLLMSIINCVALIRLIRVGRYCWLFASRDVGMGSMMFHWIYFCHQDITGQGVRSDQTGTRPALTCSVPWSHEVGINILVSNSFMSSYDDDWSAFLKSFCLKVTCLISIGGLHYYSRGVSPLLGNNDSLVSHFFQQIKAHF